MATIKSKTIKANSIKAKTITSSSPRPEPAQSQPQAPVESRSKPKSREERVTGRSSVQSLSKPAPVAPLVPKQTPPNLANLAHNPGAITSQKRIEAQQNFKPVEDIITAQIVGNDFSTGETKVKDGSGNIYSVQIGLQAFQGTLTRSQGGSAPSVVVGQSVIISRARSQQGEVNVRLLSIVPLRQSPQDALAAFSNQGNINDLCKPSGSTTSTQNPPDRPEDPETPEVPAPPTEPSPNQPEPEEDPPSKPFGCNPGDSAQWYNGESCPAGMNSLGFAQLSDGSIKTLCEGANPPPGDGCPESPDEYGYICVSGECQYVPFGLYATKEECEGNCSNEPIETCEVPLPVYGPAPFEGGQCPAPAQYSISYELRSRSSFVGNCGPWGDWQTKTTAIPSALYYGPISYPETLIQPNSQFSSTDSSISYPFTYHNADGVPQTGYLNLDGTTGRLFWSGCGVSYEFRNFQVTRVDGGVDDCGDPQGPIIGYTC